MLQKLRELRDFLLCVHCRHKYATNFEKFAELLIQAIVCCIPAPHQYGTVLDAATKAELEALRVEIATVLQYEVASTAPTDPFMNWCVVGGVVNPQLQYLSQLVSVAYAFELSRNEPFNAAAVLEALYSGPPASVMDWSKSSLRELRNMPLSCLSHRDPSCLSFIPLDSASVTPLADALANSEGLHFLQYVSCLWLEC
jgi:hypothetical protein